MNASFDLKILIGSSARAAGERNQTIILPTKTDKIVLFRSLEAIRDVPNFVTRSARRGLNVEEFAVLGQLIERFRPLTGLGNRHQPNPNRHNAKQYGV